MKRLLQLPAPRTLTFWHFQIVGWSLMIVSDVVLMSLRPTRPVEFLVSSSETPFAFLLSLILRQIYMRLDYRKLPMAGLIAYIGIWSLVFTVIWYSYMFVLRFVVLDRATASWLLHPSVALQWINYLAPIWFGWSALYFGIKYWRDWDDERERARKAVSLARHAQLEMLRYQLNPHFLFNALNSVRALVDEDRSLAKGMVTELSEFLRYSLVHRDPTDVPLRDELAAIQHYLSIEKKRFEDKLWVSFSVDQEAADYPVLSFLLHPLVENAVKYGMKTSPMPLRVQISATVSGGDLQLDVTNSGRWMDGNGSSTHPGGTGTGLDNVRARLENAYAKRHSLDVTEENGFVHVRLKLFRKDGQ